MMTLATINTTTLVNKELGKELDNIQSAIATGNNCVWDVARGYANIVNNELFEEDFEDKKTFSEFVGVSSTTMTQYTKAVEFVDLNKEIEWIDRLTVNKAYILSTIDDLGEFINWLKAEKDVEVWEVSDKALKSLYKEYSKPVEEEIEEVVEEPVEETEEITEEPTKEDVIRTIKELMEQYNITLKDLR